MIKTILVGAALAAFATGALAQDKRPDYGTDINAAGAKDRGRGARRMPEEPVERRRRRGR
jgi:glc operon protein GlcG